MHAAVKQLGGVCLSYMHTVANGPPRKKVSRTGYAPCNSVSWQGCVVAGQT